MKNEKTKVLTEKLADRKKKLIEKTEAIKSRKAEISSLKKEISELEKELQNVEAQELINSLTERGISAQAAKEAINNGMLDKLIEKEKAIAESETEETNDINNN